MKITVCIGSSCHIKGSRLVVEKIRGLITEKELTGKVEIGGTFCLGKCQEGVCVLVDEEIHSVSPETVEEFFENQVVAKL